MKIKFILDKILDKISDDSYDNNTHKEYFSKNEKYIKEDYSLDPSIEIVLSEIEDAIRTDPPVKSRVAEKDKEAEEKAKQEAAELAKAEAEAQAIAQAIAEEVAAENAADEHIAEAVKKISVEEDFEAAAQEQAEIP